MDAEDPGSGEQVEGWVFLHPEVVPDQWRDRAVTVAMVPLFPGEGSEVLGGRGESLDPLDERVLRLVARGKSVSDVAGDLGVTARSVERRLARLRQRLGVASTAELIASFARRGFS